MLADDNKQQGGSSDGRGNFGNPEQHREAGKQSHKND
jgi:hypothetical protein